MQTALMNVRFEENNGRDADVTRCLLMTQSWMSQNLKCGLRATLTIAACARIGLDGTAGTGTRALPCRVPNRLRGLCLALLVC